MIRTESEYREALARLEDEKARMDQEHQRLEDQGLTSEEIDLVTAAVRSFHEQLVEEVQGYERLLRGDFDELQNFQGLGRLLIGLRIFQGITQRGLAERLGVSESQVSRDERNEYHNVTIDRAQRILEAMGIELETRVKPTLRKSPVPRGLAG